VKVNPERKIPYEILCLPCQTPFKFFGVDTGDYLLLGCPTCGKLIGVKKIKNKLIEKKERRNNSERYPSLIRKRAKSSKDLQQKMESL